MLGGSQKNKSSQPAAANENPRLLLCVLSQGQCSPFQQLWIRLNTGMKSTILALLIALAGCGGNISSTPPQKSIIQRSGTVFVGDSIFGFWDLDRYFPGKGYVNAGWFGKRTDEILAVFPSILDGSKVCSGFDGTPSNPAFPFTCRSIPAPAEVVILLGWNDLFQGADAAQAAANINAMVDLAQAAGVKVILVIPYRLDSAHPASWMQPWDACSDLFPYRDTMPILNAGIRDRDAQKPMLTADLESLFTCQSNYTTDGVHPNDTGYQQMHDLLVPLI